MSPAKGPLAHMLVTVRETIDRLQSIIHGVGSGPYPGMHIKVFPGPDMMQRLFESGAFAWCGYYLAPAPYRIDASWVGKRAQLVNQGWGLAPCYLGHQQHFHSVADWDDPTKHPEGGPAAATTQAEVDCREAAKRMEDEGFPSGSVVFLDVEDEGAAGSSSYFVYVNHWLAHLPSVVTAAGASYAPGIYLGQNHPDLAHFHIPASVPRWLVRAPAGCFANVKKVPPGSNNLLITKYADQSKVLDADGWSILQDPDQMAPCQMWQWGMNVILSVDHTGFRLTDYNAIAHDLPAGQPFGGLDYDTSWVADPSVHGGGDTMINYVKSVTQEAPAADVVGGDDVRLVARLAKPAAPQMGVDVVVFWGASSQARGYVIDGQTEAVVTVPTKPVQAPTQVRFVAETAWWRHSRAYDERGGGSDAAAADVLVNIVPR